jgi:hypothetical protein
MLYLLVVQDTAQPGLGVFEGNSLYILLVWEGVPGSVLCGSVVCGWGYCCGGFN